MSIEFPTTAHGVAVPASEEDLAQDAHGLTNPNLHRRIDPHEPTEGSKETAPRNYIIGVYDGLHSYRTETIHYHDEESTTSEIP